LGIAKRRRSAFRKERATPGTVADRRTLALSLIDELYRVAKVATKRNALEIMADRSSRRGQPSHTVYVCNYTPLPCESFEAFP
jgi:hypothetical protein